jgi:hypothetical protein
VTAIRSADSDEVARAFQDDVARCSDMMSPGKASSKRQLTLDHKRSGLFILTVVTANTPRVNDEERVTITPISPRFSRVAPSLRRITRWEHEHVLEAVQQRLDANPQAMRQHADDGPRWWQPDFAHGL